MFHSILILIVIDTAFHFILLDRLFFLLFEVQARISSFFHTSHCSMIEFVIFFPSYCLVPPVSKSVECAYWPCYRSAISHDRMTDCLKCAVYY